MHDAFLLDFARLCVESCHFLSRIVINFVNLH
jgi:hypothetical protein